MEVTSTTPTKRRNWSKSKKNKILLGGFLMIIALTIFLKIIVTILWDTGYYKGNVHLWYWQDDAVNALVKKHGWDSGKITGQDVTSELARRSLTHPYFFWSLTQFTWQTTLIITFVLSFRLFMYDDRVPKWLRWTQSQRTLSIVTMYDVIVGVVFWSALAKDFQINQSSGDHFMNLLTQVTTILVHAIIPVLMVLYSLVYLFLSTEASRLRKKFLGIGIIYPTIYVCFYLLVSVIWRDPYPVSDLSVSKDFSQIWIAFVGLVGLFLGMAMMIFIHNFLLFKFNKKYSFERDFEVADEMKKKLEHLKWKVEKNRRKIQESGEDQYLKKEKLLVAKQELAIIKTEIAMKKRHSRASKTEEKYTQIIQRKKNKTVAKATKPATKPKVKKVTPTKKKKVEGKKKPETKKKQKK